MPIMRPPPAVLSIIVLLLVASSAVVRGQSENSIVCSEDTRVTRDQNGDLVYGSLPPTDPPQTEEYSPQGLEAWYSLPRHFVDGVQGDNLPYGEHHNQSGAQRFACSALSYS